MTFSLDNKCCMCSITLSPITSRACCSLAKARRLRRRQVAFTQQRRYGPSFVRSLTFVVQLLKHGMNAFAQSRERRLTSDRLLSKAVAMRRQTLGRAAVASGTDSFFSLRNSTVLPRVYFASVFWAPACFFICFLFSASFLECEDVGCRCCSGGSVP